MNRHQRRTALRRRDSAPLDAAIDEFVAEGILIRTGKYRLTQWGNIQEVLVHRDFRRGSAPDAGPDDGVKK
jgi:hypothetical protein